MCDFFSFVGDGYGNFLYSDWNKRKSNLSENWDSHTKILTDNKVPPSLQDRWSKYEYNPLTKAFKIDEPVDGHDHEAAENWVNHLDFKQIVEPLIIKKIKNPLTGKPKKVTEEEICLLKQWISVWDSVWYSVWDSVWDSVRDSVRDYIFAYTSSLFDIKHKHDFSSCIKLWNSGFVPSFDGKTWRLHSGKNAKIVYEEVIK